MHRTHQPQQSHGLSLVEFHREHGITESRSEAPKPYATLSRPQLVRVEPRRTEREHPYLRLIGLLLVCWLLVLTVQFAFLMHLQDVAARAWEVLP